MLVVPDFIEDLPPSDLSFRDVRAGRAGEAEGAGVQA